jgi:hypothetical protein
VRAAAFAVSLMIPLALPSLAIASSIRQVTFTGNSEFSFGTDWLEDGVTASGEIDSFGAPDTVHLDPGGTPYGSTIMFTTGSSFDALSVDLDSPGGLFCAEDCGSPSARYDVPYPNVWISGFVDDVLVAAVGISQATSGFETFLLGGEFAAIDRLVVEVRHPVFDLGLTGACLVEYCGHFNLDNVVLRDVAPIPEPAAALLFLLGVALVASKPALPTS